MRESVINEALKVVIGQRQSVYGAPENNFRRIAALWNQHRLNKGQEPDITVGDVATYMILMKIARLEETPNHRDSVVDIIGYAACYADIELKE